MATELLLVRHAPSIPPGRLYGRTDVPADVTNAVELAAVARAAGDIDQWVSSPALRCRQTLAAIWGDDAPASEDARLWEQDFGDWDGLAHEDIPDMGELAADALAEQCPPGGESFRDVCRRVHPALLDAVAGSDDGRIVIVAHAGVVRAAIAMCLTAAGSNAPGPGLRSALPLALSFEVQPLSLTKLRVFSPDAMAIAFTNWRPQCT